MKYLAILHAHYHRHTKFYHLLMFACIAIIMTIIGESGIARLSFAGFVIHTIRLLGEIIADIIFRSGFFKE